MSADQPDTQPAEAEPSETASPSLTANQGKPDHIYLVPYPKIVFFYPSLLTAIGSEIGHVAMRDALRVDPGDDLRKAIESALTASE